MTGSLTEVTSHPYGLRKPGPARLFTLLAAAELVTATVAAGRLGVHRATVYRWAAELADDGLVEAYDDGTLRLTGLHLDAAVERHQDRVTNYERVRNRHAAERADRDRQRNDWCAEHLPVVRLAVADGGAGADALTVDRQLAEAARDARDAEFLAGERRWSDGRDHSAA